MVYVCTRYRERVSFPVQPKHDPCAVRCAYACMVNVHEHTIHTHTHTQRGAYFA